MGDLALAVAPAKLFSADVLAALASRFPADAVLDAHSLIYPDLYREAELKERAPEMQQRLQKIKELYCRSVKLPITHAPLLSITAKAPVDWEKLEHQYSTFFAAAVEAS